MTEVTRRGFLGSILALAVAPAIVRAESLMPVRLIVPPAPQLLVPVPDVPYEEAVKIASGRFIVRTSYMKQSAGGFLRVDVWSDNTKDYQFCDDAKREVTQGITMAGYTFHDPKEETCVKFPAIPLSRHDWKNSPYLS